MKAFTIWQPWCSLIVANAKRNEFRGASYLDRRAYRNNAPVPGERIALQAGARKIVRSEVREILERMDAGESGLNLEIARPIVMKALDTPEVFPLGVVLGTAIILKPVTVTELFGGTIDSDRLDHSMWAWPFTAIEPLVPLCPRARPPGLLDLGRALIDA
jgi:hypothetical protein